jgi:hypothetical protein
MRLPIPDPRHVLRHLSPLWSGVTGASPHGQHEAGGDTLGNIWRDVTGDPIYGNALTLAAGRTEMAEAPVAPAKETRDDTDAATSRCRHCGQPIRLWQDHQHQPDRTAWLHTNPGGAFPCRDEAGVSLGTYATPTTEPSPPISSPAPLSSPEHHDPALVPDADPSLSSPATGPRPSRRLPRPYPVAVGTYPKPLTDGLGLNRDQHQHGDRAT